MADDNDSDHRNPLEVIKERSRAMTEGLRRSAGVGRRLPADAPAATEEEPADGDRDP